MGMTTKQFNAFLRLVLTSVENAIEEQDPEKKNLLLAEIAKSLRSALVK